MKLYIFICARVQRKMRTFSNYTIFNIQSSTWKLKQNKCTRKCSKRGNTPRKWWFKSNQFKRIHVLTSFCLASDPRRKTSVSHTSRFEKDRIRTSRCSDGKFPPHLPPRSERCGRQSSTIPVETQTLTLILHILLNFFLLIILCLDDYGFIWSIFCWYQKERLNTSLS